MTISDALKLNGFNPAASGNSVNLAQSMVRNDENIIFAMQAQLYQDLAAKKINMFKLPASQRYNAIFVITDRRLFFCQSLPNKNIQMYQWLFDVKSTQIKTSFLSTPVLSILFGFEELQIFIPSKNINAVNACLQNAIRQCPVTAEDIKNASKKKKPAAKPKTTKAKSKQNDDFVPPEVDFYTKVVGVTFKNSDGSDRQKIISKCKVGQDVVFKPTPTKEYPEAVGVFTTKGKQLGNLKADLAHDLIHNYPNNPMQATIADITGGNGQNYGCNIHIHIFAKK